MRFKQTAILQAVCFPNINAQTSPKSATTTVSTAPPAEIQSLSRDNSSAELKSLSPGTFEVGKNLKPGRYVFSSTGSGNFTIYDSGGSLYVNEILTDDTAYELAVPTVTADVIEGDKIEISGMESVRCNPAKTELSLSLSTGYWVVGLDINPGTYDVTPKKDESGNFIVYSGGKTKTNEILGNSGFGVSSVHVTLESEDIIYIASLSRVSFKRSE